MKTFNAKLFKAKNLNTLSRGFTLIEVLVALLLMSITGFSILSVVSFSNQEANHLKFEISADYLGRELLSRAQANGTIANRNLYAFNSSHVGISVPNCSSNCNEFQIASLDVAQWTQAANETLPAIRYRSWWDGNTLQLAIAWKDPSESSASQGCPLTLPVGSACRVYSAAVVL